MKYKISSLLLIAMLIGNESVHSEEENYPDRSYHGSSYDVVTGSEHNPFMFTTSSLGQALRATASLQGHVFAALEDDLIKAHMYNAMPDFCEKVLNLYVLCYEAQKSVIEQLHEMPEKSAYLLEEVEHLQQRILSLLQHFRALVGDSCTHEMSTVLITLHTIIKKTGQMLAM